jgi:hypothetical protein
MMRYFDTWISITSTTLCISSPILKNTQIQGLALRVFGRDMSEILKITRSNYYHWLNTDTSKKDLQTQADTTLFIMGKRY